MNQYKNVKVALRNFLMEKLSLTGEQVFRAPPKPTSITHYPAIIIRSAQTQKINEDGPIKNDHRILLGIMTRGRDPTVVSDELDDLLQSLDNAVSQYGARGLDANLAENSRWTEFTRANEPTDFNNVVQDDVGYVVYGVTAGIRIREVLPTDLG